MDIMFYAAAILAAVCVLSPHEFAHAFVAYKNGDPTAKAYGRMTLNPFKHIDLVGFIMLTLVGFGWAKPVPINPYNFKNYKVGMFTTAIAGITINFIIAFIIYPLYLAVALFLPDVSLITEFLYMFLNITFTYSMCSIVFNLLPFSPLDGFRVVQAFTREINPVHKFLKNYGQAILIVLIVESYLCNLLSGYVDWATKFDILGYVMTFATEIIGLPIRALWNTVFGLPWNMGLTIF